jgi:hypothetical protein
MRAVLPLAILAVFCGGREAEGARLSRAPCLVHEIEDMRKGMEVEALKHGLVLPAAHLLRGVKKEPELVHLTQINGHTRRVYVSRAADGTFVIHDIGADGKPVGQWVPFPEGVFASMRRPDEPPAPRPVVQRRYPPLSIADTMGGEVGPDGIPVGRNQKKIPYFSESEILQIHPSTGQVMLGEGVVANAGADGRITIQQQGQRACTAAASGMLIHDAGKPVNVDDLKSRNLGNKDSVRGDIERAGLKARVAEIKAPTPREAMQALEENLRQFGSAVVSVGGEIGGHVIVVDSVDLVHGRATIRDPWHGWRITVTLDALAKRTGSRMDVVQVLNSR